MGNKTHQVRDLHYHEEEGNIDFVGTYQECLEYQSQQSPHFMYQIEPLTKEEYERINNTQTTPQWHRKI